tara:strand:- start:52 stop:1128 length:1077 start_codon:yes stop_codon:yes gene_type:complete
MEGKVYKFPSGERVGKNKENSFELKTDRKALRAVLASFGIALMPMKDSNDAEASVQSDPEPTPNFVSVENEHNDTLQERLANESMEDMLDRTVMSNFREQGVSTEEIVDEFSKRIQAYASERNEWDISTTKNRALETLEELGGLTKMEYLKENIKFGESMPADIQSALVDKIDGVPAAETNYDETKVSPDGAFGALQTMPETYEAFGGEKGKETSWVSQVTVAGRIYTKKYEDLAAGLGEERLAAIEKQYPSRESYVNDFWVPLLFGAYHAGGSRWKDGVEGYTVSLPQEDWAVGKDFFPAVADYSFESKEGRLAEFGPKSREYPFKVLAWSYLLNQEAEEESTSYAQADISPTDNKG